MVWTMAAHAQRSPEWILASPSSVSETALSTVVFPHQVLVSKKDPETGFYFREVLDVSAIARESDASIDALAIDPRLAQRSLYVSFDEDFGRKGDIYICTDTTFCISDLTNDELGLPPPSNLDALDVLDGDDGLIYFYVSDGTTSQFRSGEVVLYGAATPDVRYRPTLAGLDQRVHIDSFSVSGAGTNTAPGEEFLISLSGVGAPNANAMRQMRLFNTNPDDPGTFTANVELEFPYDAYDDLDSGFITFAEEEILVSESAGYVNVDIQRVEGAEGTLRYRAETQDGSAVGGMDYGNTSLFGLMLNGEDSGYSMSISISDNTIADGNRDFMVSLEKQDDAFWTIVGPIAQVRVVIVDDEDLLLKDGFE